MSSILKALRKVGEEKRVDQHAAPDLRLDQGLNPAESKPFLPLLTGIALGAVIVGLLFLWVQKGTEPVAIVMPTTETAKVVTVGKKAVDFAAPVSISSDDMGSDQSLKTLSASTNVPVVVLSPEPKIVVEDVKVGPLPKPPVKKQLQSSVASLASKPAAVTQTPSISAATKAPAVDDAELPEGISLLVTEIFYQQDNANSMAVVNDLPVMIGTHVDSAVVTEIKPEAVLFKIDGKFYNITIPKP